MNEENSLKIAYGWDYLTSFIGGLSHAIFDLCNYKLKNKEYTIKKLCTENRELYGSVKPT